MTDQRGTMAFIAVFKLSCWCSQSQWKHYFKVRLFWRNTAPQCSTVVKVFVWKRCKNILKRCQSLIKVQPYWILKFPSNQILLKSLVFWTYGKTGTLRWYAKIIPQTLGPKCIHVLQIHIQKHCSLSYTCAHLRATTLIPRQQVKSTPATHSSFFQLVLEQKARPMLLSQTQKTAKPADAVKTGGMEWQKKREAYSIHKRF